ncbi:MAG: amidohydrolase, partial [Chloroflexi bacterium]|nr:amidohydrolase [Chloroflexota bacterium]
MKPLVIKNAQLYTFNPHQPAADAMVIVNGVIQSIGKFDQLDPSFIDKAAIEDLGGAFILPGFTDAHIHLLEYGLSLQRVECETVTREDCIERVRQRVVQAKPGEWVLGHGWNHNIWHEGKGDKTLLDNFSTENPIYLTHKSLHSGWANSAALHAAGIDRNAIDPKGGLIERDENGEPTGIVYEGAMRLVESAIPTPNVDQRKAALVNAQQKLISQGITAVHDFDVWECYQTLQEMEQEGRLKISVTKSIPFPMLDKAIEMNLRSGTGSNRLRIGWLKLFSDGALGPQTAAMLEPYIGSDSKGMLFLTSAELAEIGRKAMSAGISLAVHAIGDRANREILDGFAQLKDECYFEGVALRPRIEHVQIITPEDVQRLAALGVWASMQPIHAVSDRDMADKYWGERCRHAYAWKSVLDAGGKLIFGSDAPVESPNPMWGLAAAAARTSMGNLE